MRRIAFILLALGLAAAYWACSSDAPAPTPPGGPPGQKNSALVISLFTTNANPGANACTLIQAVVTFNGQAVIDGTGVQFSSDLGTFAQNGTPSISMVTSKGTAVATLCSTSAGTANVTAAATVNGVSAKSDPLKIVFQAGNVSGPFFTFCSPSNGPNTGGTTLVINGGRFPGDASSAKATFTAAGATHEGLVTSVTPTAVTVVTPAFPEATAPSVPVTINLTLAGVVVTVPNCFSYGTASSAPTITAMLPASGTKDGNTRVSIIGGGFVAPLQVFFIAAGVQVEVNVVSISYNTIVITTPPSSAFSVPPPVNSPVDVRVHEVNAQPSTDATLAGGWKYTEPLVITGISPLSMPANALTAVTIFGRGFLAPVLVTFGANRATVQSVSDTEILAVPVATCSGGGGPVSVTNLSTGETGLGPTLTITGATPTISAIIPSPSGENTTVTIQGTNLPTSASAARVLFGAVSAGVTGADPNGTFLTVNTPAGAAMPAVCPAGTAAGTPIPASGPTTVTVTNSGTGCSATGSFTYLLPCTVAPDLVLNLTAPATVTSGTNLVYTYTISNAGSGSAAGVSLSDPIPAGVTYVSCTSTAGTCANSAGTFTASLGTLAPASGATVTLTVTVTAPAGTVIGNTANVTTTTPEPNVSNNSASVSTTVN
jgi:uncharacterized repeat protein (TIGR01451 family)